MNKIELMEQLRLTEEEMVEIRVEVPESERMDIHGLIRRYLQAQLNKALNHPITRPCGECGGKRKKRIILPDKAHSPHSIPCPTCNGTGEVSTTLGKLAEEWNK